MEKSTYIIDLIDKFSPGLKSAQLNMNSFDTKVTKTSGLMGTLLTGALVTAGIAVVGLAGKMITLGAEMEQTQIAMEVMVGSAEVAAELFDQLNQYANITPFSNTDILDTAKTLLLFGGAAEDILPTVSMLGDVAAGNSEKLRSLTLAFAQMSSTGRLTGQDLLQMVNAGFNPLQQISKDTGISMGVLKKQMEAGAISTDLVKEAFVRATSEGGIFFQMTEKQAATMAGMWSTVTGTLEHMMAKGGLAMESFVKGLLGGILEGLELISRVDFSPITSALGQFWDILSGVFTEFGNLMALIFPATDGMTLLQAAFDGIALTLRVLLAPLRYVLELFKMMIMIVDNLVDGFTGLGMILIGVFTKDILLIKDGFNMAASAAKTGFSEVLNEFKQFARAEQDGWDNVFAARDNAAADKAGPIDKFTSQGYGALGAANKGKGSKGSSVDGEVRSGGVKNININIANLVKEINFQQLDKLSETQVVAIVKQALLTAVNDANLAVS